MNKLTVLNVAHGDSLILSPAQCKYDKCNLFIDLGPGRRDVFAALPADRRIVVLLSHAHHDHIGGLAFLFNRLQDVEEILLPLYFDEINAIYSVLLSLRGVEQLPVDNASLQKANKHFISAKLLEAVSTLLNKPVTACYDGLLLCDHISISNPHIDPGEVYGLRSSEIQAYRAHCASTDYRELRSWFDEKTLGRLRNTILTEGWTYDCPRLLGEAGQFQDKLQFVWGFIFAYKTAINEFVAAPSPERMAKLYAAVETTSNDASIVMHYDNREMNALFPGDVSKRTLARMLSEGKLPKTHILKIPHHGSRHNLSESLLKHMNPRVAIVSHNNRKFGKQKDPHPHTEVMQMLANMNIHTLYTNDVIKNGSTILQKPPRGQFSHGVDYLD